MLPPTSSLSRTSSATSVSSCEDAGGSMYMDVNSSFTSMGSVESNGSAVDSHNSPGSNGGSGSGNGGLAPRRTRKRFSNVQLSMLENLFHQNSHPSREDREDLAARGDMEVKSVTIWFQNKRQMERKVALNNASGATSSATHSSGHHTHKDTHHHHRSRTLSHSAILSSGSRSSARPSLDSIATRAELMAPRTPKRSSRTFGSSGAIYDNMPSSPPDSSPMSMRTSASLSPYSRDFVEFGKMQKTRTLEWACAAARLHGVERKEKSSSRSRKHSEKRSSKDHHRHHHSSSRHHSSSKKDKDRKPTLERRHSYAAFPTLTAPLSTSAHEEMPPPTFVRRNSASDRLSMVDITSEFSDNRSRDDEEEDEDDDEDDASTTADEATTPPGTLSGDDIRWRRDSSGRYTASATSTSSIQGLLSMERKTVLGAGGNPMDVDDDDMNAALLLCGLSGAGLRRRF